MLFFDDLYEIYPKHSSHNITYILGLFKVDANIFLVLALVDDGLVAVVLGGSFGMFYSDDAVVDCWVRGYVLFGGIRGNRGGTFWLGFGLGALFA